MESLLRIGLTNAIAAAVLAALAAGVARVVRRPALTHALWVLVLFKLLTPPIWTVSMQRWLVPATVVPVHPVVTHLDEETASVPVDHSAQPIRIKPPRSWQWLSRTIGGAWLAGLAVCLIIAAVRWARFTRLLRFARLAPPDVQAQARSAAHRIGVRKCPAVWILPGPVCPMLWAAGGPARVIVPAELWERLSAAQREGLLLHELAHVRRRDHWVRLLELGATVAWWWNPVVWWARRELRTAEEECCDAWVTGAMPEGADDYASALVEAVDFASVSRPLSRPMLPALASGIGEFGHLKRRLVMIQQGNGNKSLGRIGMACVCAMGLLLPMALTWAQEAPKKTDGHAAAPAADKPRAATDAPAKEGGTASRPADEAKVNKALAAKLDRQLPELNFDGVGFADVIDFLRDVSGANIFVNWKALEAAKIDRNAPVTAKLHNVKFSKALNVILDSVGGGATKLGYTIDDDVIVISTREPDAGTLILRVYNIKSLVNGHPERMQSLVHMIAGSVDPSSWQDKAGGPSIATDKEAIVVVQTEMNQKAVANLLEKAGELLKEKPGAPSK